MYKAKDKLVYLGLYLLPVQKKETNQKTQQQESVSLSICTIACKDATIYS